MKPKFSTLITLTFVCAILLTPFALGPLYLPELRNSAFEVHQFLRADLYKQITGYTALAFVLFEMLLTLRKRGRRWNISLPGSVLFWRSLHVFLGIALVGTVLVHTGGAMGKNYNTVFLWVFWGTSLSALVGVTTETGILESPIKVFGLAPPGSKVSKVLPRISKGPLIRGLRGVWLATHIFLVSIFLIMLGFHIFLAYYYQ